MAISGNVTTAAGQAADWVRIFRWPDQSLVATVQPAANGDWSLEVPVSGDYGLTYLAAGCQPITHGPYFIEGARDADFDSVVLLMHLDDDFSDYSNAQNQVTPINAPVFEDSKSSFSKAIKLNGTNQHIYVAHKPALSLSGKSAYTGELWFNTNAYGRIQVLLSKRTGNDEYSFLLDGSTLGFYAWNSTGTLVAGITSTTPATLGGWHHAAFTIVAGGCMLFLDGNLVGSGPIGAVGGNSAPLNVGRDPANASRNFSGLLDDVRLTAGVARYTESFVPPVYPFPNSGPQ